MVNFRIISAEVGMDPQTNQAAKMLREHNIPFMQRGNVFRIHDNNAETVCKLFNSNIELSYDMYTDEEISSET